MQKSSITTLMIIRNDEKTIENSLKSILPLEGEILIADLGCKDRSPQICRNMGATVINLSLNDNFSQVGNQLIERCNSEWILFIEPWEKILTSCEKILHNTKKQAAYRVGIIQGDLITKQIRLWHKGTNKKFVNPAFEMISGDAENTDIFFSSGQNSRKEINQEIFESWLELEPMNSDVHYYHSCMLLMNKKWNEYLSAVERYFFMKGNDIMPEIMTRYYCSLVQYQVKKDFKSAIANIAGCLTVKPLMAEFWCALGDFHYGYKQYEKALTFYRNAIDLGKFRQLDEWPMEVSKYRTYPQKMIVSCQNILNSSKSYRTLYRDNP